MKVNMKLVGDKKLQRAMREIESKTGRKVIRSAVREGAKMIQRQAQANAPVLNPETTRVGKSTQMPKPGTLRKGITVKAGKRKRGHYRVNVVMKKRSQMGIPDGAKYYAPSVIEYGSRSVTATHFVRRAFEQRRADVDARIVRRTRTGILLEWRRLTR